MKNNPTTSDIHEAMARVEKARGNRTNAARRLSRAQAAVEAASTDVANAEKELVSASSHLDQTVKKALGAAMKKGGTDMSIALAEIIARTMPASDDEHSRGEDELPLGGGSASGSGGGETSGGAPSGDRATDAAEGGSAASPGQDQARSEASDPAPAPSDDDGNAQTSLLDDGVDPAPAEHREPAAAASA